MKFFVLLFSVVAFNLIALAAIPPKKSLPDPQKEFDHIQELSNLCVQFSDWFGDSMKSIRDKAEKEHPGPLKDLLDSVVDGVDGMLDSNDDVNSRGNQQLMGAGLIKCSNVKKLEVHFKTLSQETLNEAFVILDQMLIETKKFEKTTRKFEEKYIGELFPDSKMATVKTALSNLAKFATKNPKEADIKTEQNKVKESILQPLLAALNHKDKNKLDEELITNMKTTYLAYSKSMEEKEKELLKLK